ncbi:hypothetical protein ACQKGC_19190 [Allorhizobium pseudoryzae]|uniref:hypothetical protein n=1 Tax=Allorhizobium pseudoryzae TaxID=379684 RepID=UPI003D069EB8
MIRTAFGILWPVLDKIDEGLKVGGRIGVDRVITDQLDKEVQSSFRGGDILVFSGLGGLSGRQIFICDDAEERLA